MLVQRQAIGGDLITGARNTHIATLVERNSRYLLLVRVTEGHTNVVGALIQKVKQLPRGLLLSLTWDRVPSSRCTTFSRETGVRSTSATQEPWQRGRTRIRTGYCGQYFERTGPINVRQHDLDVIACG